ncbi:MAG: hypothetical protein K6V97_14725 [Actinomycetia bacterium]|nr:hypothetical protein [Actinomycetes bacterium]
MGHVIRAEWRRGTHSWRFWAAVTLTLFVFLLAMWQYDNPTWRPLIPRADNFYKSMLDALGAYLMALWPVVIPVVAALPAGDSVAVDRRRGVDALAITRVGWTGYLAGKLTGSALVAVAAVALATGMAAAAAAVAYPVALPKLLGWTFPSMAQWASEPYSYHISGVFASNYATTFQAHLFWAAPGLYVALVAIVALWATASLSALAVASSAWIRVPVLALAVPVVLFLAGDVVTQGMGRSHLVPSVYAGAYLWSASPPVGSWWTLGLYWLVPAAAAAGAGAWIGRRREWPPGSVGR